MDVQQRFNEALNEVQIILNEYTGFIEDRKAEVGDIHANIESAKGELATLTLSISLQNDAYRETLLNNSQRVDESQLELKGINEQLLAAKAELATTSKKHAQFVEYMARCQKILRARETTILDREERLEDAINLAKRRHRIIDNVI